MRLRWDWLGPLVTAPLVPTIGPVHPDEVGPGLFSDVISVAGTNRSLAYDKDRRWFDAKADSVLIDDVVHRRHETWLPVLSRRGAGSVTLYVYGMSPDDHQTARQLASEPPLHPWRGHRLRRLVHRRRGSFAPESAGDQHPTSGVPIGGAARRFLDGNDDLHVLSLAVGTVKKKLDP